MGHQWRSRGVAGGGCQRALDRKRENVVNGRCHQLVFSPELLAAQAKLTQLRAQRRVAAAGSSPRSTPTACSASPIERLPAHLGWGCTALTAVVRRRTPDASSSEAPPCLGQWEERQSGLRCATSSVPADTISLQPAIGLALLREEQAAAGRVWLLLRYLDSVGRGWVTTRQAHGWLTVASSPYRICGDRQLRKLLVQGEGLFWRRRNGRIWLHGLAKTAANLKIRRLSGQPVRLPINALLGSVGVVRAHLYAAFHSSRNHHAAKPIARATLQKLSRVSRRSQRNYEQRAGIRRQRNLAVGELNTDQNREQRGQKQGQALFTFNDNKGKQGSPGKQYLAWQLPNSYIGPHQPAPLGRQKRINRELADLFMQGMTGNGEEMVNCAAVRRRRFQTNGAQAARQFNQNSQHDLYWPRQLGGNGRTQLWHLLPGQMVANEG
jgi:hypothetical protein